MRIENLHAISEDGVSSVRACVDGALLYFETNDAILRASPEAFGTAFLIPSIARGETLEIDGPLSAEWLRNTGKLLSILKKWWGYPALLPRGNPDAAAVIRPSRHGDSALVFTGGVDSFFTLLHRRKRIDFLVHLLGYEIPPDDAERSAKLVSTLREIAASRGCRLIVIRTNLKQHSAFAEFSGQGWDRAHGGAIVAAGHLLSDLAGELVISSTYPFFASPPFGSHWRIDGFWSSEKLTVVHFGAARWRARKLDLIAREPLVRRHLRVCLDPAAQPFNCSACHKCVLTMFRLAMLGELQHFAVFDHSIPMAERIASLPLSGAFGLIVWEKLWNKGKDRAIDDAVASMLARSREALGLAPHEGRPRFLRKTALALRSIVNRHEPAH